VKEKLRSAGIEKNTIIFFISDNGGAAYTRATDNAPLRGGSVHILKAGCWFLFLSTTLDLKMEISFMINLFLH
jgi:hypothetical protein